MRVLIVNNVSQSAMGGAETVVHETGKLLKGAGHQVSLFSIRSTDDGLPADPSLPRWDLLASHRTRISDSLATVYSVEMRSALRRCIRAFRPDVAHLHNVYEKLTLSVVDALVHSGVPTVMTLHDYRAICPNGRLWTEGAPCHRCPEERSFMPALRRRCQHDSLVRTVVAASEAWINSRTRRYFDIDVLIAPSRFLRDMVSAVIPHPHFAVVPNPATVAAPYRRAGRYPHFVFAGRLVPEKGIGEILDAAAHLPPEARVTLVGEGRAGPVVRARLQDGNLPVRLAGALSRRGVQELFSGATAALLPSQWYENCPMAIIEAAAMGTPSIATRLGGMEEVIEHGTDGFLVPPKDSAALAETMCMLSARPEVARAAGRRAREKALTRHGPHRYLASIIRHYRHAMRLHGHREK
jgi:glycosyltransferase involved in cell wall biosynthesis